MSCACYYSRCAVLKKVVFVVSIIIAVDNQQVLCKNRPQPQSQSHRKPQPHSWLFSQLKSALCVQKWEFWKKPTALHTYFVVGIYQWHLKRWWWATYLPPSIPFSLPTEQKLFSEFAQTLLIGSSTMILFSFLGLEKSWFHVFKLEIIPKLKYGKLGTNFEWIAGTFFNYWAILSKDRPTKNRSMLQKWNFRRKTY